MSELRPFGDDPYEDLPFSEQERARTFRQVCDAHSTDFLGFVAERIVENNSCRILDIGSGNSTFGIELATFHPQAQVFSLDLYNDTEREFDRSGVPQNFYFVQADGGRVPFQSESFDLIVMTWSASTYGHGPDIERGAYITEAARLLRPGGMASIHPESRIVGTFPFETIMKSNKVNDATKAKAIAYETIRQAGYRIFFEDEAPTRARIFPPKQN